MWGCSQKRWGSWEKPVSCIACCLLRRAALISGSLSPRVASSSAMFEKLFLGHRGIDCSRKRRAFVIRPTGQP